MISIYLDIKVFIIKFYIGDNARLNEFSSHLWTPVARIWTLMKRKFNLQSRILINRAGNLYNDRLSSR